MKTNVLVTGANGQLAQTIKEQYYKKHNTINFSFVDKETLDITDFDKVNAYFIENNFDYCINCAAYTNVEQAQEATELAFQINAQAVKNLAIVCRQEKVTLIHISTDYVFDGAKQTPYIETDRPNPINKYGESKLKGEQYISEALEDYFIIRTSWLYSAYGKNFVKTIVNKINENSDLKVTTAETGTPTSCIDLAQVVFNIVKDKNTPYGTYHYSNEGEATWYDFAKEIAKHFNDYDTSKILPVDFFKTKAQRPKYSGMSKKKLFTVTKRTNNNWQDALKVVIKILNNDK